MNRGTQSVCQPPFGRESLVVQAVLDPETTIPSQMDEVDP